MKNIIIIILAFMLTVIVIDDSHQRSIVNQLNDYLVQIGEE
jgi:hypothetical protein